MKYIAVVGPTASGKSHAAKSFARRFGGEIVSCDSVQVYRGFDIGTAKEDAKSRKEIPHHLIDVVHWNETYDAARYARDARDVIRDINRRGKIAIVTGGTGLYLRALMGTKFHDLPTDENLRQELANLTTVEMRTELQALDPDRASVLHPNDRVRLLRALELVKLTGQAVSSMIAEDAPQYRPELIVYMNPPRAILHKRIALRTQEMLAAGLVGEVESMIRAGCPTTIKPMKSIGYAQVVLFLSGAIRREDLENKILYATRQYAKRQCTWFGKLPFDVHLDSADDLARAVVAIEKIL